MMRGEVFKGRLNNYVHLYSFLPFQRKIKKIIFTMIANLTKVQKKVLNNKEI